MAISISEDQMLMIYPLIKSGVKASQLQRAYHRERETPVDEAIADCLDDRIQYGEQLLELLERMEKDLESKQESNDLKPKGKRESRKNR